MKMSSRDKRLIFPALFLGIVAASWFGGARIIKEKTKEMTEQKEALSQEYDERIRILSRKEEYQQATRNYNDAYQMMLDSFPADISQVRQILFVAGLEERYDTQVVSVSYTDPAAVYEFQTVEPGHNTPRRLVQSTLQIPIDLTYEQWKDFLEYVFTYQDKNTIPQVTAVYDERNGKVHAEVVFCQYAIQGEDRILEE